MRRIARAWAFPSVAVLALLISTTGAARAQTGAITGQVTDRETAQPLARAQVIVVGTNLGALTNEDGRYRIERVPAGAHQVRVVMIGYDAAPQTVTVSAGTDAAQDFALETSAISLDAIVATATGEQRRRTQTNSVAYLNAAEVVEAAPITNFSELLNARVPGVQITQASGTTGAGARIRIRGSNSVSLGNEPIFVIDGVRVNSAAEALSVGTGGQAVSRINDINPEELESIEIVKGPSAATLYGTDAANGVIRITTKRGRAGAPRWNLYSEFGLVEDNNDYPLNYAGVTADGESCLLFETVGDDACTQSALNTFQPLEDDTLSPFALGDRQQYGFNVSGGSGTITYFAAAEFEKEDGTYELPAFYTELLQETSPDLPVDNQVTPNDLERVSVRANVGAEIAPGLHIQTNAGFLSSDAHLPQNDNNSLGIIPSGLLGSATRDDNDGFGFRTPAEVFAIEVLQEIERFTGSSQLEWRPPQLDFLSARATIGVDFTTRRDSRWVPPGQLSPLAGRDNVVGNRDADRWTNGAYTLEASATASFDLTPEITSRTTGGGQYFQNVLTATQAEGLEFVPGSKSLGAAAETSSDETTTESVILGGFVEQQFGFRDRLFLSGAVRFDDASAFGSDFGVKTYPKAGASYVLIDEGLDQPVGGFLNALRLRGSWGASGVTPEPTDALRFFNPATATLDGADVPGVTFGELGNEELEPERSEEFELGFDAGLFDNRVGVDFTWYNKETDNALIDRQLPLSLGTSDSRFENLGSVRNRGFEVGLTAQLLDLASVGWDVAATGSFNDNELLELGEGIEPIIQGVQRFVEGFPLGGFWERPVSWEDANGDGVIAADEVEVGDEEVFLGSVIPERQVTIQSSIMLFARVRISGLLDHRGDFKQYNFTEEFRCNGNFAICRGLNDPTAPLWEQARAVQDAAGDASGAPFIEDGDFWKLREVSVTFLAPDAWATRIGAERLQLVLTGRNLATWTDYTGLDPEVNQLGQNNFTTRDFLTQPQKRTWVARVNLSF